MRHRRHLTEPWLVRVAHYLFVEFQISIFHYFFFVTVHISSIWEIAASSRKVNWYHRCLSLTLRFHYMWSLKMIESLITKLCSMGRQSIKQWKLVTSGYVPLTTVSLAGHAQSSVPPTWCQLRQWIYVSYHTLYLDTWLLINVVFLITARV